MKRVTRTSYMINIVARLLVVIGLIQIPYMTSAVKQTAIASADLQDSSAISVEFGRVNGRNLPSNLSIGSRILEQTTDASDEEQVRATLMAQFHSGRWDVFQG